MSEFTTPQNPLYRRNSDLSLLIKFDNDFVSHSIPRSDLRYQFILNNTTKYIFTLMIPTLESHLPNGYFIGGHLNAFNPDGFRYFSEEELLFPVYGSPLLQTVDGFSVEERTYTPFDLVAFLDNAASRNFWDKRRGHHFTAHDRNNNIISASDPEELVIGGQRYIQKKPAIKTYQVSPVSDRYFPIEQASMVALNENLGIFVPTEMKYTLGNNFGLYGISSLDRALGISKEEDYVYERVKRSYAQDPSKFGTIKYREKIYPKESNVFLNRTRTRPDPLFWFWSSKRGFFATELSKALYNTVEPGDVNYPTLWAMDTFIGQELDLSSGPSYMHELELLETEGVVDAASLEVGSIVTSQMAPHTLQDYFITCHRGVPLALTTLSGETTYEKNKFGQGTFFRRVFALASDYAGELIFPPGFYSAPFPAFLAFFEGTTQWRIQTLDVDEVGDPVILSPFYDRFIENSSEIRTVHKNKAVIPEYRILDHLPYYLDDHGGNFLSDGPKEVFGLSSPFPNGFEKVISRESSILELQNYRDYIDSYSKDSSQDEFFAQHLSSSEMNKFGEIKRDHKEVAFPTKIKLTVRGVKKFTPSTSFYPIEAALELSRLFSIGVSPNAYGQTSSSSSGFPFDAAIPDFIRPIESALFGPGIFYNTIKSGTAVSSRIRTEPTPWVSATNPEENDFAALVVTQADYCRLTGHQVPNELVPFESLLEPEKYLSNRFIYDNELHRFSRVSVGSGRSFWNGVGHHKYKLAMHNFLAESTSFFIGQSTSFLSSTEEDFKVMTVGKEYRMRVVLRTSQFSTLEQIRNSGEIPLTTQSSGEKIPSPSTFPALLGEKSTYFSKPTISIFDRPYFNNNKLEWDNSVGRNPTADNRGAYEHAGSAFGPAHAQISPTSSLAGGKYTPLFYYGADEDDDLVDITADPPIVSAKNHYGISYDAWTPPYQQGYAHAEISFTPFDGTRKYTMREILDNSTVTLKRWGSFPGDIIDPEVYNNNTDLPMQISSTVDLFSVTKDSDSKDRWRIGMKYETPIFDYSEVDAIVQSDYWGQNPLGFSSTSRGPWLQYGVDINDPNKGLFLEIMDTPSEGDFGSLADIVNIKPTKKRVGELLEKKKIIEAVVTVPYVVKDEVRKFIKIDRDLIDRALNGDERVPNSILEMTQMMSKYVIPPKMNFLLYDGKDGRPEVDPIAMYFFEFDYDLEREDLKRIWHNVMPTNADKFEEQEVVIEHELLPGELLSEYADDNLKWMVFKVKQKAATNYYEAVGKTGDLEVDIDGNTITPEYSYNWPYDNLSIVEMAEVEAEVLFEKPEDAEKRRTGVPEPFDIRDPFPSTDGLFGNTTKLYNKLSSSLTPGENS